MAPCSPPVVRSFESSGRPTHAAAVPPGCPDWIAAPFACLRASDTSPCTSPRAVEYRPGNYGR
eukprot:1760375-Pyramimonas_sp.AAC.1